MANLGFAILIILVGGLVLLVLLNQPKKTKKFGLPTSRINIGEVKNRWSEIESTFALGGPSHFKSAIMEADKLVDSVLVSLNFRGSTMAERLKSARPKFKVYNDYNNLWFAHKVRNSIAHDLDHELNSAEAKRAMEYYRKALKELGVI